jgi:hypothetical protein
MLSQAWREPNFPLFEQDQRSSGDYSAAPQQLHEAFHADTVANIFNSTLLHFEQKPQHFLLDLSSLLKKQFSGGRFHHQTNETDHTSLPVSEPLPIS